jgi:hypothetical protein
MVGPAVGSLLYSLGGYTTPFIVFGSSTLVVAPIAYFIIKRSGQEKVEVLLPEG